MSSSRVIFLTVVTAVCVCCVRQAPQRPSTRHGQAPEVDSASLALIELNYRMAAGADRELASYVQTSGEPYALYDNNTWLLVTAKGEESIPLLGDEKHTMHLRLYDLQGRLLEDVQREYTIGRMELPLAVEGVLPELHPGATARLLAPWYAAFGTTGTATVPPYTNIMIDLEIQ